MLRVILSVSVAAVFLGSLCAALAQDDPQDIAPKESAEQKAVRAYLKENTSTGKIEEVRWWIPRAFRNGKRSIRLKYRTANALGAIQLYDDAFYLKAGKITEWHKNEGKLFHGHDDEKSEKPAR